jgi:hypothetical protein
MEPRIGGGLVLYIAGYTDHMCKAGAGVQMLWRRRWTVDGGTDAAAVIQRAFVSQSRA